MLDLFTCEQVVEYEGHMDAYNMAKMLGELGAKYNKATIYVGSSKQCHGAQCREIRWVRNQAAESSNK